MAIAKMEKRSTTVWNRSSAITVGIGALLALISLILLWGALKTFMVKSNYVKAAFKHDSNRRQDVKSYAESARAWGRHPESTELLAKVLVESNSLDNAEKLYSGLASGPRRAMGLCGLGLVLLRRADAEKDQKKAAELARKAKEKFVEARGADSRLIEAQIGSATADLIAGVKMNDAAKIAVARSEFSKVLKALQNSEDLAADVTREGYMDLYVGLARSNASPTKFSHEALAYAGAARRYLPTSMGLYAMELALQAQQMVDSPPVAAEVRAAKTFERLKSLRDRISSTKDAKAMEDVADAWFALTLASAAALARGGTEEDLLGSKNMLELAQRGRRGDDALLAEVLEATLALELARKPEKTSWNKRQTNYSQAYAQFQNVNKMKELEAPSRALLRAALLNNQAFFEEDSAAQGGGEHRYQQAVALLTKALELEVSAGLPNGSYEVQRNLAVIQFRRDKPEAADHFDAAQKAAVDRTEDWVRRDLEDLRKYFAEKK
jgi:hypothetical protein